MGWLSWERFRCNTDCDHDPEFCIGENLFRQMADMMVTGGYREVGYDTVIIDDCWLHHKRLVIQQMWKKCMYVFVVCNNRRICSVLRRSDGLEAQRNITKDL